MQRVKYKSCEASSKRSFKIYDRPVGFYFQITNDKKFIEVMKYTFLFVLGNERTRVTFKSVL